MKQAVIAIIVAGVAGGPARADEQAGSATNAPPGSAYTRTEMGGHFGVGLMLGEPTGLSLKYFLSGTVAVDGAVGWSFHDESDLYLHSDLLWHKHGLISVSEGELSLYLGAGARVKFRDNAQDRIGLRLPLGATFLFDSIPVDVFAELAPIVDFAPSTKGGFTAGIGARYWF